MPFIFRDLASTKNEAMNAWIKSVFSLYFGIRYLHTVIFDRPQPESLFTEGATLTVPPKLT